MPMQERTNTIELTQGAGTQQIPEAPYYVLSNDTFMSGWGHAQGKTNTVVLPCRSHEEAEVVVRYAKSRQDQQRVRIVCSKPQLRRGILYSVVLGYEQNSSWYSGSPDAKE